jgi:CheY-like chemotaxis protein
MPGTPFSYRVLIVDDEPTLILIGKSLLESQGYEVHVACDGLEGLSALRQASPDLIISDLNMPNMNGFEFLTAVRARFPNIPVIVISGDFVGTDIPDTVAADAFFPKGGYKPHELFLKIADLFEQLPARRDTLRHILPAA